MFFKLIFLKFKYFNCDNSNILLFWNIYLNRFQCIELQRFYKVFLKNLLKLQINYLIDITNKKKRKRES